MLVRTSSTCLHACWYQLLQCSVFAFGHRTVAQADLDSSNRPMRKLNARPSKEFQLKFNEFMELLKPLYGLTEAGYYFQHTFSKYIGNDVSMLPTTADLALYTKTWRISVFGGRLCRWHHLERPNRVRWGIAFDGAEIRIKGQRLWRCHGSWYRNHWRRRGIPDAPETVCVQAT